MRPISWLQRVFLSVLVSVFVVAPALRAYDDVPSESPYFYAIEYLRKNDVFQDTKQFKPDSPVSRAEFIVYLVKLNSPRFEKAKNIRLPYSDTSNNAWYAPYMQEGIRIGVLTGNEKKLDPDRQVSLLEALELLYHSRSIPLPRRYVGEMPYRDLAQNKGAQALVMRSMELGIVAPQKKDFFGLYRKINRAEAAKMIYKMDLVDLRESVSLSLSSDPDLQRIQAAWNIIQSTYVDKESVDPKKLSDSAIKAMVESLNDPYSTFLTESQNRSLSEQLGGKFEGIGAVLDMKDNQDVTVVSVVRNSPAEKAGLKSGDVIRKVDDFDTKGVSLPEVTTHIKGAKGTSVRITFERNGQTSTVVIVRDLVELNSVEHEVVGQGKVMWVRLALFDQNLAAAFAEVAKEILQTPAIKGIVLDMRDNPGGLVEAAIGVLNHLLPNDSVAVSIQYGGTNYEQYTTGAGELSNYPVVVLVNGGTASAAEIVAGAVKDHLHAKIVGQNTFGKGTVQEINAFVDGSSLKLTIAKWLTPAGANIHKVGIAPDIAVAASTDSTDPQLDRAIAEVLKGVR